MKKSKLSLCMMSCLLAVSSLAGCDKVRSSSDGVLLTYYVDGQKHEIKADDILEQYYDDSSKYQAIYDQIYSVIVRNYFAKPRTPGKLYPTAPEVPLGSSQMDEIERNAKLKVEDDKATAKTNAKANKTRYKKEFNAILEEKGVKTEPELFQKYVEELQKETFENNFYTYSLEEIKSGKDGNPISVSTGVEEVGDFVWNGYINDKLPYHVSHVMVALSDSSDTNYYNGTISETDALNLANMVESLESSKSFAAVAADSADVSSGEKQGDLGIMDFDTSFINEFKLGIYAYEQFYKATDLSDEIIKMSDTNYVELAQEAAGVGALDLPLVNPSVFEELAEYADDDKDASGNSVIGGSTLVLPRNIIYNKYLNNHSVFFIGYTEAEFNALDTDTKAEKAKKYKLFEYDADPEDSNPAKKYYVLNAQTGTNGTEPVFERIIAVRGSSGDKQEIHFIVVNRSPFDGDKSKSKANREVNGVKLSEYYTTFSPREAGYPKDGDGKNKTTYVNSLNNDEIQNKDRATEFASKLKSYDSDKINKYMFLKYMNEEKITFGDNQTLAKALMKWIKASVQQANDTTEETWKKTVDEYLEKLTRQNAQRSKLIPEVGKYFLAYGNDSRNAYNCIKDLADKKFGTGDSPEKVQFVADVTADLSTALTNASKDPADYLTSGSTIPMKDWFKVKGELFNDGETHI